MCPVGINNKQSHAAANPKIGIIVALHWLPSVLRLFSFRFCILIAVTVIIHHQQGIYNQSAS